MAYGLEVELHRQLHLSRPVSRRLRDLPEAGIVHGGVWGAEHRMVERVLRLDAELEIPWSGALVPNS